MSRVLPYNAKQWEIPLLMNGRRTMMRQVIKPQPTYSQRDGFSWRGGAYGTNLPPTIEGAAYNFRCASPYQPGDTMYVRETWSELSFGYVYKADGDNIDHLGNVIRWHPSIHMPKEAARIWLKVKDVRVERLQDMNEVDTAKEGIWTDVQTHRLDDFDFIENFGGIELFKNMWNSTIKKSDLDRYGWDASPWVWVIEFERCEKPEVWCV